MTGTDPSNPVESDILELDAEPPFHFSEYAVEDYAVLLVFWLLAANVFAQFFSRFVLGDSIGWTEEMARYLLIGVGFLGGAMAVRRNSHIMMEFLHRYMSPRAELVTAAVVDTVRIGFFAALAWLSYALAQRTHSYMTSVDVPKSVIYYVAAAGLVLMTLRALQRATSDWRRRASGTASGGWGQAAEDAVGNNESPR
ncbi:TRAP transporter small permease [Algihabitans albus]|uniref:TRAP transporter small permease n=1 Tax=Algihabitans albus TaxID=2164067 RepID=UPI000E5D2E76|nr:TRAP transporter small permease [Algihabitans albus]